MQTDLNGSGGGGALVVSVKDVTYSFSPEAQEPPVLKHVNLEVRAGELLILTGPSGSGKTTILTLIGALRTLQSGSISVFDQSLADVSESQRSQIRRDIGFIFQDHNLFEALTVLETLQTTLQLHRNRYKKSDYLELPQQITESLGLSGKSRARARELSTGQKQRVAIGRALINRPRLVLADEPTAALDEDNANLVMSLLRRRAEEDGTAVLLVTHDTRHFDAADRVIELVDGTLRGGHV